MPPARDHYTEHTSTNAKFHVTSFEIVLKFQNEYAKRQASLTHTTFPAEFPDCKRTRIESALFRFPTRERSQSQTQSQTQSRTISISSKTPLFFSNTKKTTLLFSITRKTPTLAFTPNFELTISVHKLKKSHACAKQSSRQSEKQRLLSQLLSHNHEVRCKHHLPRDHDNRIS